MERTIKRSELQAFIKGFFTQEFIQSKPSVLVNVEINSICIEVNIQFTTKTLDVKIKSGYSPFSTDELESSIAQYENIVTNDTNSINAHMFKTMSAGIGNTSSKVFSVISRLEEIVNLKYGYSTSSSEDCTINLFFVHNYNITE